MHLHPQAELSGIVSNMSSESRCSRAASEVFAATQCQSLLANVDDKFMYLARCPADLAVLSHDRTLDGLYVVCVDGEQRRSSG